LEFHLFVGQVEQSRQGRNGRVVAIPRGRSRSAEGPDGRIRLIKK
jgi:hypothetical protein